MTKFFTVRLNVVVSNAPVAARLRKFLTLSGATSGIIAISIVPTSISKLTHCAAIFSTDAPSNGSGAGAAGAAAVLSLAFLGPLIGPFGVAWPSAIEEVVANNNRNMAVMIVALMMKFCLN